VRDDPIAVTLPHRASMTEWIARRFLDCISTLLSVGAHVDWFRTSPWVRKFVCGPLSCLSGTNVELELVNIVNPRTALH
jgi:hypothetical protein